MFVNQVYVPLLKSENLVPVCIHQHSEEQEQKGLTLSLSSKVVLGKNLEHLSHTLNEVLSPSPRRLLLAKWRSYVSIDGNVNAAQFNSF